MAFEIPGDIGDLAVPQWNSGFGLGLDVGNPGGGTGGYRIAGAAPPAPTNVRATVVSLGTFKIEWDDYSRSDQTSPVVPFFWLIRYCPSALAGYQGTATDAAGNPLPWPLQVLDRSHNVGTVQALGDGHHIVSTFAEYSDGYVQVVGSNGASVGPPSFPIFLNISGNTNVFPGAVRVCSVNYVKERVPYDVIRLDCSYNPPADIYNDFAGVHPHVVGYDGVSTPREIGSMIHWGGSTGFNQFIYRLPVESGLGSGTATFAASTAVTRVSGTAFDGSWVGRKLIADIDASTASQTYEIDSVTNADHLVLTGSFYETPGTYSWRVFNEATYYFVTIGKSGARDGDITTALSFVV